MNSGAKFLNVLFPFRTLIIPRQDLEYSQVVFPNGRFPPQEMFFLCLPWGKTAASYVRVLEKPQLCSYWMTSEASISDVRSLSTERQNFRRALHKKPQMVRRNAYVWLWRVQGRDVWSFWCQEYLSMNKESLVVNYIFLVVTRPSDVRDYACDVQIYHENWFSKFWMTFTACHTCQYCFM